MRATYFILSIIFFNLSCNGNSKEKGLQLNAFPNANYNKVIAYRMDGENNNIIDKSNNLTFHVVGEGVVMNRDQVDHLLTIFHDKESYGDDFFRCFEPHLGIVFYDKLGKPVAHSTICFECNWMRTSPDIGAFIFSKKGHLALLKLEGDVFNL